MYIDTHCHLSLEDYEDIDAIITDNRQAGIENIIISGCTKDSIVESLEIANKYDDVFLTIGFHPSEASITSESDLLFLKDKIINNSKVIGIGEIGLDYHYGRENIEEQKNLFRKQLTLAEELELPVVIHSRDATADTINILSEYPSVKGDIHCFSGSIETAKIYISMGYYLGIGGVVTFKNSNLYKIVEAVGIDHILLETDSPYLTPEPFRGKINSSKYIPLIAKRISDILMISEEEVSEKTIINTKTLFDFK